MEEVTPHGRHGLMESIPGAFFQVGEPRQVLEKFSLPNFSTKKGFKSIDFFRSPPQKNGSKKWQVPINTVFLNNTHTPNCPIKKSLPHQKNLAPQYPSPFQFHPPIFFTFEPNACFPISRLGFNHPPTRRFNAKPTADRGIEFSHWLS